MTTTGPPGTGAKPAVAPENVGQARAWDGDEGAHWVAHADRYDRAVAEYRAPLTDAAAVGPGEAVVDIGCGNGRSTLDAARAAVHGTALGIDLSARMLELARTRGVMERLDNVRFEQGDAQVHDFRPAAFDVVLSRFGAMFFADHGAAFRRLAEASRPGGRLALLAWQGLGANEWLREIRSALAVGRDLPEPGAGTPTPFGLSEPGWVQSVLTESGWAHAECTQVVRPVWLGNDADDALAFLRGTGAVIGMLQDLDVATAARALDNLHRRLAAHQTSDGVQMGSSTWLVTARRSSR